MSNTPQRPPPNAAASLADSDDSDVREIHALTPPQPLPPSRAASRSPLSTSSSSAAENFTTMSREFHALVLAGSNNNNGGGGGDGLGRIGEDEQEETNPLAISVVPEVGGSSDPVASPGRVVGVVGGPSEVAGVSIRRVKKEEVESKVMAWQTEEVTKINNRFKREDTVIKGWEGELVEKASSTFKKIERKLEEKRAKAMEKMQNDIARAHRKAEEKRASAEAKRGTKVARVLELANLMRAIGRAPSKRSVF